MCTALLLLFATSCWSAVQAEHLQRDVLHRMISRREANGEQCQTPMPLAHGTYRFHPQRCPSDDQSDACRMVPGTLVPSGWVLYYKCDIGYQVTTGRKASICSVGQWMPALGACTTSLNLISREGWGAQTQPVFPYQEMPVTRVIIQHTATSSCDSLPDCMLTAQSIQQYHIQIYGDIGYNFLVGGEGSVLEGQGWDKRGAHTINYNTRSIGVALIGNFENQEAPEAMLAATRSLIDYGLSTGKIAKDFKLNAHCQLIQIASPGKKVFHVVKQWPNWNSVNAFRCTM